MPVCASCREKLCIINIIGETGVSWHVFQRTAHKPQESLKHCLTMFSLKQIEAACPYSGGGGALPYAY